MNRPGTPGPRGFHLADLCALVLGYGMASLLVRAFWPVDDWPSAAEAVIIVLFYCWLGLAMSGPLVLLVRRPAGTTDGGAEDSDADVAGRPADGPTLPGEAGRPRGGPDDSLVRAAEPQEAGDGMRRAGPPGRSRRLPSPRDPDPVPASGPPGGIRGHLPRSGDRSRREGVGASGAPGGAHTWAELAWLIIGFYWIALTVLVVPVRLKRSLLPDAALVGLFPIAAALVLQRFDRGARRRRPAPGDPPAWTHRAAVGLLLTWPIAWVALILLGKSLL